MRDSPLPEATVGRLPPEGRDASGPAKPDPRRPLERALAPAHCCKRAGALWRDGWYARATPVASPNHGPRPADAVVSLAVLHSISLPPGQYGGDAIEHFFCNRLPADAHPYFEQLRGVAVSAHFLVRRDGALVQFVSTRRRAWHAGASSWRGRADCNDYSVGIELEGLEGLAFERAQYGALVGLLRALRHACPLVDVAGHEHVAPGRKGDPGAGFDWALLQRLLERTPLRLPQARPAV